MACAVRRLRERARLVGQAATVGQGILSRQCPDSFAPASRYTLSPFSCADALALDLPVLLVGEPQSATVRRDSRPTAACLHRTERAVVANSSHGMSLIKPAELNAVVLEFKAKH